MSRIDRAVTLDAPTPTVQTHGRLHTFSELSLPTTIEPTRRRAETKPPYSVPSMSDIRAIEPNGYTLVSTFSGCGGSCLGFRMAGFRPLWASEFIPAARDTYLANFPETPVDSRDIRTVTATEILTAIGRSVGDIDVLEGSPPCASFSTAGKREAGWGKVNKYSDTAQRVDDLFYEFIRLVDGLRPRVFVAENVSGLVKGSAKGYFKDILRSMKACGYHVEARLLDAQWLGVPQMRQRIIFVGVRDDLDAAPAFPFPLPYRYSVRDALPWITRHGEAPPHAIWVNANRDIDQFMVDSRTNPCPTILQSGLNKAVGLIESCGANAARVIHDTSGQWSQGDITDRPSQPVTVGINSVNSNHFQIEQTDISRYAIGREWDKLAPGEQSDKYRSLIRTDPDAPCTTVLQRGGDGGDATVTHPTERRKFTIAELRRICAFPDDFVLTGTYAQQWERLGRAVPPVMMRAVAETIRDEILRQVDGR